MGHPDQRSIGLPVPRYRQEKRAAIARELGPRVISGQLETSERLIRCPAQMRQDGGDTARLTEGLT